MIRHSHVVLPVVAAAGTEADSFATHATGRIEAKNFIRIAFWPRAIAGARRPKVTSGSPLTNDSDQSTIGLFVSPKFELRIVFSNFAPNRGNDSFVFRDSHRTRG